MNFLVTGMIGGGIVLFGGLFFLRHCLQISDFRRDPELHPQQKTLLISQQKRRMWTSGLLVLTGLLIPFSYDAMVRQQNRELTSILLLAILGLLVLISILAIADLIVGRSLRDDIHLRQAELELKRRLLKSELEKHQEIKRQRETKGSSDTESQE